jgi:hypothetical protein
VNATIEGVVRAPSAFSITFGLLPSITETHEFVVPRSIPIALAMMELLMPLLDERLSSINAMNGSARKLPRRAAGEERSRGARPIDAATGN